MHQHISKQPLLVYVFNTGDIKKNLGSIMKSVWVGKDLAQYFPTTLNK